MSDLRDQLLKAGLVDKAKAKRVEWEERKQGRRKTGKRRPGDDQAAPAAGGELPSADTGPEADARAEALCDQHRYREHTRGGRRWYYVRRDGRADFMELNDGAARKMESGEIGVAEAPDARTWIVSASGMGQLAKAHPAWLRFWSRR